MHLIPHILGDEVKTKALIEYVIDKPVSLSFSIEESFEISEKEKSELVGDKKIMGLNMTLGNTIYDYLEVCILKIQNLTSTEFLEYFDEKSESKKLINEMLNDALKSAYQLTLYAKESGKPLPIGVFKATREIQQLLKGQSELIKEGE